MFVLCNFFNFSISYFKAMVKLIAVFFELLIGIQFYLD